MFKEEKIDFTEIVKSALLRSMPPADNSIVNDTNVEPPLPKRTKSLFSFMPEPSEQCQPSSTTYTSELDSYLQSPCVPMETNPATFLKTEKTKYPILSQLAKEVMGVPSSSAPVERFFSIAGKVFRPEFCNLKDQRFEQLMFIRCNNTDNK